ncbi:MAG: DUF2569 family protein [Verrucomicrobia bacterium]|nr:DUF2569 family protein [Verrucomicrobiota bacterium]
MRIYLGPIVTALTYILISLAYRKHTLKMMVWALVATAGASVIALTGIAVGLRLRDLQPRAVQAARRWLIMAFIWAVISTPCQFALFSGMHVDDPETRILLGLAQSVFALVIWYSYFRVSKRVRATYPDWKS